MANLFDSYKLGDIELKNRMVMAPLTRSRAGQNLEPREMNRVYYTQRATAGLIVTEATHVLPEGVGYPGTPGIGTPEQIDGWKTVVDSVHNANGKIFVQLWHVGRISHRSMQPGGKLPVAPSAIAASGKLFTGDGMKDFEAPRALETDEIPEIVEYFRLGAQNAKAAGFDGVEIHGANGYLLDQFLEDSTNQREDNYGGSIENRARLLLEVVDAAVEVLGKNRVGVRLSPAGAFNSMNDSDPAKTFAYAAEQLNNRGIVYLHVIEPDSQNVGFYRVDGAAASPTKHLRTIFKNTLITAQGYDFASGSAVIERGDADLVAFGKLFIANPDLPERFKTGAPLNEPNVPAFYGGDERGYIDYPTLEQSGAARA